MQDAQVLYRARARANGGYPGQVSTGDGSLRTALCVPRELGETGGQGSPPEQLLAAAYAACFYIALERASSEQRQALPPA